MFLRLSKTDFDDTLVNAWDDTALQCDKGEQAASLNTPDGRSYFLSVRDKRVDMTDATKIKYFDYPECTRDTDDWNCQMYLPQRSK